MDQNQSPPKETQKQPWWFFWAAGALTGIGIFIKSLVSTISSTSDKNLDRMYHMQEKTVEVVGRSNELMKTFLEMQREQNKRTSNEILSSDSTYFNNRLGDSNGGTKSTKSSN